MPRVPVINQRVVAPQSLPSVRSNTDASPETFGASLGRAGQQAAAIFADIHRNEQQKADTAAVLEGDNGLDQWEQEALFDREDAAFKRRGKDAMDLESSFLAEFDQRADAIEQGLGSDRAKAAFRARALQRRQSIHATLNKHEFGETQDFYDQQETAKLASSRAMAGNYYNDPERIGQELGIQAATLQARGSRLGWSEEQTKEAVAVARSGTHLDVVNRYIATGEWRKGKVYFEEVRDQLSADDGTRIEAAFTAERRREESEQKAQLTELKQALNDQVRDIAAAAQLGIVATEAPSRAALVAAFGEREGEQRHRIVQTSAKLASSVNELHTLPAAELIKRAEELRPTAVEGAADQVEMHGVLMRAAAAIVQQREKDPAGYLTQHSPTVEKAWHALSTANAQQQPAAAAAYLSSVRAAKEQLGIEGHDLLPNGYAEGIVARLTQPQANEDLANLMAAEAQRWGPAWPLVYRQVQKDLPDTALVIGSGIPAHAANALASMSMLKDEQVKAQIAPTGTTWRDLEETVDNGLEDMARTFGPEGAPTFAAIRSQAQRLTAAYMAQGSSLGDAAEQATRDLANDRYAFSSFRGHTYRVPVGIDAESIDDGATEAIARFTAVSGTVPTVAGVAEEALLDRASSAVRAGGYWVVAPDESGLVLYMNGEPVPGVNRLPVQYSWSELSAIAAEVAAVEAEKLRKAQERVAGSR